MRLNIVILDTQDREVDELVVEMASNITKRGVIEGIKRDAPDLLQENVAEYSVSIEPPDGVPLAGNLLEEGSKVIIKPSVSSFRIVKRRNDEH